MFTKLRNRFLILNVSLTSAVMIAAFAIIYFITASGIHSDVEQKLNTPSEVQVTVEDTDLPDGPGQKGTTQHVSVEGPLSFIVEVDAKGSILNTLSMTDMPEETYRKAVEIAWSDKESRSPFTLEGKKWRYTVHPVRIHVTPANGQPPYTIEGDNYQILFLDVTESERTLFELLLTLVAVGLIMLLVIFIICLYFANRAIRPIAAAWEKQKQFVADASHELKTPLSIINANYDVLAANPEQTVQSQLKWLGYIRIGTDRMTKLVNDLLALAKMDDASFDIQKAPFNMSGAVTDVMQSMEAVASEKGIAIAHSIEPDVIARGDPEKVKQVVAILFDNAVKYSEANGRIGLSLTKSKRQVQFSITNGGAGIPRHDLPKVFDRFYRADRSRTHESGGYGLGLSIAKSIMDRLGGEIRAESVEGESTTFTLTLGA